jgi:NADPH:quinone reductase-like Zn-dependent oxidoreductase
LVVDGPADWVGAEVWGTGDIGFAEDGTHCEFISVHADSLRRKPGNLSFDEAATVGVSFITAWLSLVEATNLQPEETVAIIGAGGAVGNAAAQIAFRLGAKVIGLDRTDPHTDAPILKAASHMIIGSSNIAASVREVTDGKGVQVVFNLVGGALFEPGLNCLALRGRMACISSVGSRDVTFNLLDFYHNESRVFGVDSLKRNLVASSAVLEALKPGFEDGSYSTLPISKAFGLDQAVEAYKMVANGSKGRVVLRPQG